MCLEHETPNTPIEQWNNTHNRYLKTQNEDQSRETSVTKPL